MLLPFFYEYVYASKTLSLDPSKDPGTLIPDSIRNLGTFTLDPPKDFGGVWFESQSKVNFE